MDHIYKAIDTAVEKLRQQDADMTVTKQAINGLRSLVFLWLAR